MANENLKKEIQKKRKREEPKPSTKLEAPSAVESSKEPKQPKKEDQAAPTVKAEAVDLLALVLQDNWPVVKELIEEKKVGTIALLDTVTDEGHAFKGANVFWLLVAHHQWPLIQALIEQKQVTTALLASQRGDDDVAVFWYLAKWQQWPLIQALIEQKQVTTAVLASQGIVGIDQGKNVCWYLANYQQWSLLKILIDQKQVTTAVLASQAVIDADQGKNVCWFLANHQQWPLLKTLIDQKQVTTAVLASQGTTGINQGGNAFWFLALGEQWLLIQALIDQKQVTTAVLANQPTAGPNQGINALSFLAFRMQWPLIQALIEQKQITTQLLLSKPRQGGAAGLNVLTHFTQHGQWDLIRSLIPEINTQLLLEGPTSAPGSSLLRRLLFQGPDRGVEFFKLLLDAPLNPLAGVPWEEFAAETHAIMVVLLQRGDSVTFARLAELGVALPPPQDPRVRAAMSQLSLNKEVVAFSQIVEVYKQYYPQPADKKIEYPGRRILTPDNPLIPDVKDVKPEAQNTYWHWVALETMKEQAEIFGCYRSEMKSHAQTRNQQLPEPIMELIQFYAAGDQQGVPYLFENEHASAFTQPEAANAIVRNSQHQTFFKAHQKRGEEAYQAAAAAGKVVGYFDGKQPTGLAAALPQEREKEKEKADEASASSVESSSTKQEQANDESVSAKTESSSSSSSASPMDTSESSSSNSSFLKVS